MLGKHHSKETKEKLRQVNLGKKHSDETKEKIRQGNLGKKKSKRKINLVNKKMLYNNYRKIGFSDIQIKSLNILKSKGVKINYFIRQAIKEKIKRDWKNIKEPKIKKSDCPF